jgi:prefoldin subunit 5
MTREEIIAILERRIKSMEFALERANEMLQRVKQGDEAAIREFSDLFEKR